MIPTPELYTNLFLLALEKNIDFEEIVRDASETTEEFYYDEKTPDVLECCIGMVFLEKVAEILSVDLEKVSELISSKKDFIINSIINNIVINELKLTKDIHNDDLEFEELKGVFPLRYANPDKKMVKPEENQVSYIVTFQKQNNYYTNYKNKYWMRLSFADNYKSNYTYEDFILWCGNEGNYAIFIDNTLIKVKELLDLKKNTDEVELVVRLYNDTGTTDLMDKFTSREYSPIEGYVSKYARLVLAYGERFNSNVKRSYYYHLVIEKDCSSIDHAGWDHTITMTELKMDDSDDLAEYVDKNIPKRIADQYKNKKEFYRFPKPYLLRAQTSDDHWNAQYGETSYFYIVGAYISTQFVYKPDSKQLFEEYY